MTITASNNDDDYYNWTTNTVDAGPWILIGVLIYSTFCIAILPVLITLGNKREKRINEQKALEIKNNNAATFDGSSSSNSNSDENNLETKSDEHLKQEKRQFHAPLTGGSKINGGVLRTSRIVTPTDKSTPYQTRTIGARSVRFDAASEVSGRPRQRKYTATSSAIGSALSSAFSNVSAASYYSTMSSRSRSHRSRRRGRHGARLDMLSLNQMENEALDKSKSRPLGTRIGYTAGQNAHPYASVYATPSRRMKRDRDLEQESPAMSRVHDVDILPEHAADAGDPGKAKLFDDESEVAEPSLCLGSNALCSQRSIQHSLNVAVDVANYDAETKKLLKLGIPFTFSGAIESVFDAIAVALISKYLGINALSAYVVTNLLIGLSETLVGGVSASLETLCAHAIGCDNFYLAGQYVQIASITYILVSIPLLGMWWFIMGDCIRLFRMNEQVVEIGVKYTKVVIFDYMVDGVFGNFYTLLDINGQVTQATAFDIITGLTDCILTWMLLANWEDVDLFWIGASMLFMSTVHYFFFTLLALCKGWLDPFWEGMVKSVAFRNSEAVKNVLKTAIPLSLGYILEYGEWEALTFFAAILGPAEVAAWGILESIWDLFEASTYGIASAGSIQLALHLGRGDIEACKRSTGKTLFISSVLSILITAVYFIVGDAFPALFTDDETLLRILNATIPIVGLGKIFMNFGMISWSLVGAQGRYRFSTTVSAIMSFFVTLPLSALSCVIFRFSLDGLVGAIVVGYSTTGLILSYALLRSDWDSISETIQEMNNAEEEEYSESSSEDEEE